MNVKIKNLKIDVKQLLAMTDEQIRAQFKDSSFIMKLKETAIETLEKDKNEAFMKKYVKCPKCFAPIDKFDG